MSLILEALRKSEAERRRGQMPDLRAELPPPQARAVPTAHAWRIAAVAFALLALAGWWATAAWRPPARPRAAGHALASAATPAKAIPALPPVAHLQPMPASAAPVPAAPAPAPVVREASQAATLTRPAPAAPATAPTAPSRAVAATLAPPPVASPRAMPAASGDDAATPPVAPPSVAAAAPSALPARAPGAPLQLSDLAPAERKALPTLRLSMHLWNDDPARRFVILDGTRLGEGDRLGNLVVTAIVRDGVLLDWNGRTLKVPLR